MYSLRFAARTLARNPAFTAAAVLSLALGIGDNTAIFTIADQMLLRLLPVEDPRSLVLLTWKGQFIGGTSRGLNDTFAYPMYKDLRDGNPGLLTGIAARYQDSVDVAYGGPAQRAVGELVSGNYFDVLGVTAAIGRTLTPEDDKIKDAEPYIVLGYSYWQRRFGGDASILNKVIDVNGRPMTVIGIAQRGFGGFETMSPSDLFLPMAMKTTLTPTWDDMARRNSIWLKIFARLKPGVTVEAAQAALQVPYHNSLEQDLQSVPWGGERRATYLKNTIQLKDASKGFGQVQDMFAKPLKVLLAMVGTLLLIACVNVANLLITRATARRKEIAVRLSLGSSRAALVKLIMNESVLIALAGGLFGLVLSSWIASSLVRMLPFDNMRTAITTTPDARILLFTAGLSLLTALLFGLAPALQASRSDLVTTLKNESGALAGGHTRMRRVLVAAQVTLALLLLVGAGLFARSLYGLLSIDTGIRTDSLLEFSIDPSLHKYPPQRSQDLFQALKSNLEHIPGAVAASAASFPLLANEAWENTISVEGYQPAPKEDMQARWNQLLPGFFSALGTPLIAGREFTERDTQGAPKVTIVNETFVKRFYPNQNPLGRHVGFGAKPSIEIVGVVKDVKYADLKEPLKPATFTPALQDAKPSAMTFYVRSAGNPKALAQAARQALARLDPALPVYDLKTVQTQIDETHFIDRLFAMLSAAFGFLATTLAAVGLYGVTAYAVTRRTQEIGVRMALGAGRQSILGLVMREVLLLTAAGIVVGILAALALGRLVESQLFGLKAADPAVLAAAVVVIAAISALSGYLPARRATRIDPLRALRYE